MIFINKTKIMFIDPKKIDHCAVTAGKKIKWDYFI